MANKILITGNNPGLVKDFLLHTDSYCKWLSTSDCWKDIIGHFEVFKPDAFVCFADTADSKMISLINKLKGHYSYNSAPVFIVGSAETCALIKEQYVHIADLMIKRPISPDNLTLSITRFLEKAAEAAEAEKAAKKADEKPEEIIASENTRKHILAVDDDRSILRMLKTALEETYDITTMFNGVLVEKFLAAKKVDLIILDYEMPIATGAEVFRKIKMNEKTKDIPVCFLTGVAERSKIEEIMSLKPHGYLLKPINMDMLLATISNLTA